MSPPGPLSGRYDLHGVLGRGGIGVVYAAVDRTSGEEVAIKRLLKPDTETAERLVREARAAMKVEHPNTVSVQEVGIDGNGAPFLVMERLRGATLAQIIEQRRHLAAPVAAALLAPIAQALASAHQHGVLHRDLKPTNIFIANVGGVLVPKILDFGMAKLVGAQSVKLASLTASGSTMGTPFYMSPEQINGVRALGPATDAWSFGVVMYETLTGQRPFAGENVGTVVVGILQRAPTELMTIDPPELRALIGRCLTKAPEDRLSDLADARDTLRSLAGAMPSASFLPVRRDPSPSQPLVDALPSLPQPAMPAPSKRPWLLLVGAVAIAAAGALGFMTRDSVSETPASAAVQAEAPAKPRRQGKLPFRIGKKKTLSRPFDSDRPTTEVGCAGGGCDVKCPEGTQCDVQCTGGNCNVSVGQ